LTGRLRTVGIGHQACLHKASLLLLAGGFDAHPHGGARLAQPAKSQGSLLSFS
jgi:hypothetical protein